MIASHLRVGVVGAGYWGPNVIRTLAGLPDCTVAGVCDTGPGRLAFAAAQFPDVPRTDRYGDLLTDPSIDAIAIVTPVSTHRALGEAALAAGKHVFIEKPLAHTRADAAALVTAAERASRVLAVGHVFVYHPAVVALRAAIAAGELGRLCYAESGRVNLGPPASEVDVLWDLAVHDIAILLSLLGREPVEVVAEGRRCLHPTLMDVAFVTLRFADGFVAQHHVSWLSPVRVRRFFIAGTEGAATFDDTRETDKLTLSGRGEDNRTGATATDAVPLFYRPGPLRTPTLPATLPLTTELAHFLDCIRTGRRPFADGHAGLAAVRILEAASVSVAAGGAPIAVDVSPGRHSSAEGHSEGTR